MNFEKLKILFALVPQNLRRHLWYVQTIYCLGAFLQLSGISFIVLFLDLVSNPATMNKVYDFVNFGLDIQEFTLLLACLLFLAYFFITVFNLYSEYFANKFILRHKAVLSEKLLYLYLSRPYEFHLSHASTDLINNVQSQVDRISNKILQPIFIIVSRLFLVLVIGSYLFYSFPVLSLIMTAMFTGLYLLVYKSGRRILSRMGKDMTKISADYVKTLNESFGSIKETKIFGLETKFRDDFIAIQEKVIQNMSKTFLITECPRFIIEAFAIGGFFLFIGFSLQSENFLTLLPKISLFAAATYKLLPALQGIYNSFSRIKSNVHALDVLKDDLGTALKYEKTSAANDGKRSTFLNLDNISYSYPNTNEMHLRDVTLELKSPTSLAIVGPSGCGKTTLMDVLIGLLYPAQGTIRSDASDLTKRTAYVSQQPYIFSESLIYNIALKHEVSTEDEVRIYELIKLVQLTELFPDIQSLKQKMTGERGNKFSGGQKQRIAIARALYLNRDIIVFDESTSALDPATEDKILTAVRSYLSDKIFIFVTHRLGTLYNFDKIIFLKNGRIEAAGNLSSLLASHPEYFQYAKNH